MNLSVSTQAFTILLREGLEALLIIAALAAFLPRGGASERVNALYVGALAAIVASFGMAWVFVRFFDGVHNDLIEAAVMIVAAALLLYVSGWMFVRQDPKVWQADLNRMAGKALGAGSFLSLAAIAFLAVFREGAETILFLIALASSSGGWSISIAAGLIAGAGVLVLAYFASQWLAMRLPLRPIFLITSAILFLMAIRLIGDAIQELQEQLIIPVTDKGVPGVITTLGLNASWEALGVQAVVIVFALAWAVYGLWSLPKLASK